MQASHTMSRPVTRSVARRDVEPNCPICIDPVHDNTPVVMLCAREHFAHRRCARRLGSQQGAVCPLCQEALLRPESFADPFDLGDLVVTDEPTLLTAVGRLRDYPRSRASLRVYGMDAVELAARALEAMDNNVRRKNNDFVWDSENGDDTHVFQRYILNMFRRDQLRDVDMLGFGGYGDVGMHDVLEAAATTRCLRAFALPVYFGSDGTPNQNRGFDLVKQTVATSGRGPMTLEMFFDVGEQDEAHATAMYTEVAELIRNAAPPRTLIITSYFQTERLENVVRATAADTPHNWTIVVGERRGQATAVLRA